MKKEKCEDYVMYYSYVEVFIEGEYMTLNATGFKIIDSDTAFHTPL